MHDFQKHFAMDVYPALSSVPKKEQMVVGKIQAEQDGYQLGERVRLESEYLEGGQEFTIVGIVDWPPYGLLQKEYQILVDQENFREPQAEAENGTTMC